MEYPENLFRSGKASLEIIAQELNHPLNLLSSSEFPGSSSNNPKENPQRIRKTQFSSPILGLLAALQDPEAVAVAREIEARDRGWVAAFVAMPG